VGMLPGKISRVITSPPYYGMNTYEEDQWLRIWFLGGPSSVQYGNPNQLSHHSPDDFAKSMAKVWDQIGDHARAELAMAVRFGAIGSRKSDYRHIMADSLEHSKHHWRMVSTRDAGDAADGRRQAETMGNAPSRAALRSATSTFACRRARIGSRLRVLPTCSPA